MSTILEVRNLKKHYPIRKGFFSKQVGAVKAVDGITLSVEQGETLAVVGSPAAVSPLQGGPSCA